MTEPMPELETPDEIATHIISLLSQSAYTSFAQAIREIVVNAYDAMASRVDIRFSEDFQRLSIADDGVGMTSDEFRSRYARIAAPSGGDGYVRRGSVKRRKVGKFGIGHLAIAPICRRARVVTSKGRGRKTLEATLEYAEYLEPANLDRPLSEVYRYYAKELSSRAIQEKTWNATSGKSFTVVELEDLKPEIATKLRKSGLGLTDTIGTIEELSGLARLRWELGTILPVMYTDGGPVEHSGGTIAALVSEAKAASFRVFLGDEEIVRPVRLPSFSPRFREAPKLGANYNVEEFAEKLPSGWTIRGYIVSQSTQVVPVQLRGLLIRLRGVAIGLYRPDFLGAKLVSSVFRDSTTGEIYVDEGFENAITLDRTNFKEDAAAVAELRLWISARLETLRKKYWAAGRKRQKTRAATKEKGFDERISEKVGGVLSGPRAAREFRVSTRKPAAGRPCEVKPTTGEIRIDRKHRLFRGLKPAERQILEICLYALEIARERGGKPAEEFHEDALRIMEELLGTAP